MNPEALIVGGPNGAGKSTFAREYVRTRDVPFLGADAIAARINPEQPEAVAVQAGRQFLRSLDEHVAQRKDIIVESTLAGRGPRRWLREMRAAGYGVTIVFLFVDSPEMSIRRVEARVRQGGHHVPNEAVRWRYYRSMDNFWNEYRLLADRWHLYYNGTEGAQRKKKAAASACPTSTATAAPSTTKRPTARSRPRTRTRGRTSRSGEFHSKRCE